MMDSAAINGVRLDYTAQGVGEPVLCIHGTFVPDAFVPLFRESILADRYRLVTYHRRGYGSSARADAPAGIAMQAADAVELLDHLGSAKAHVVGYSYGGPIALQLALASPERVHSLALLEPALPSVLLDAPEIRAALAEALPIYVAGATERALDVFLTGLGGMDFRAAFARNLPPDAYARVLASVTPLLQEDLPALRAWTFTADDAARIRQPVLNVVGAESFAFSWRAYDLVAAWFPQAEPYVLPGASHTLLIANPHGMAVALADFLMRHHFTPMLR
jgi:pimeloyl-ACP methyl ester carboxylesterase